MFVIFLQRLGGIGLILIGTDRIMQQLPSIYTFPPLIPILFIGHGSEDVLKVKICLKVKVKYLM